MRKSKSSDSSGYANLARKISNLSFFPNRKKNRSDGDQSPSHLRGGFDSNFNYDEFLVSPRVKRFPNPDSENEALEREESPISTSGSDMEDTNISIEEFPYNIHQCDKSKLAFYKKKIKKRFSSIEVVNHFAHSDEEDSGSLPEFRSQKNTKRRMWNQRRNTIATEEVENVKTNQDLLRSQSGGVILRQNTRPRSSQRLSVFSNTAESLTTLLRHPEKRQSFRAFLKSEYSEENFDFWLDCEKYRRTKPELRRKEATRIYNTYLGVDAPREINIDAGTRARTESHLVNPQENTFDEAQRHIFDLMERDPFRRFLMSERAW